MDVTAWLRRLGLERYEQSFGDNDIDFDLLPELTAADLIDLGVTRSATAASYSQRSPIARAGGDNSRHDSYCRGHAEAGDPAAGAPSADNSR
jgi:hypothetical protein